MSIVGDGIFDAPSYCGSGGRFGVGSDSNVLIGVADELRQLEFSQRLALRAQYHGDATNRVDRWHDGAGRPVRRRRP
ncbi:hypothetical protein [Bradyrhizobium ivorense]|uniref:hypothetical protein n=1 Tax=Bradyrhizobium ivorense TaxID=2511166 RepID=UPI0011216851|nr:hypothetical protein [Bradyrhizobium ivorense]